jgi:hypothetical protein
MLDDCLGWNVTGGADEPGVGPEVAQDLVASVSWVALFPVHPSLGQTKDIDVVGKHALTHALEVHEVVLGGHLVGVLQKQAQMAVSFGSKGATMAIIGEGLGVSSFGGCRQTGLAEASWNMVDWRGEGVWAICRGGSDANGEK